MIVGLVQIDIFQKHCVSNSRPCQNFSLLVIMSSGKTLVFTLPTRMVLVRKDIYILHYFWAKAFPCNATVCYIRDYNMYLMFLFFGLVSKNEEKILTKSCMSYFFTRWTGYCDREVNCSFLARADDVFTQNVSK